MKGKILGAGAISGEDGVRYYYDEQELKNFKEGQKIEGCEVDFDIKDGKAVGVYIVNGGGFNSGFGKVGANVGASLENVSLPSFDNKFVFWDLNEAKANLFRPNIHSIKFWFVLFLILNFFNILNLFPNTNLTWSNTDIFTGQKFDIATNHDMKGFQSLTENINFLADLSLPIVIVFVILTFGATLKFRQIKQISQNA